MTPHKDLDDALRALSDRGHSPPCTTDPEMWTGDDPNAHLQAAAICLSGCPLLEPCRTAGLAFDHGIWGGLNRGKTKPRRTA